MWQLVDFELRSFVIGSSIRLAIDSLSRKGSPLQHGHRDRSAKSHPPARSGRLPQPGGAVHASHEGSHARLQERARGRSARRARRGEPDPREQLGRPAHRAGAADRVHADRRLPRADPPAPRGGARFLQRRDVQPRRILADGQGVDPQLPPLHAGDVFRPRQHPRRKHPHSRRDDSAATTSTRIAKRTSTPSRRRAASTCRSWASAARGISASTSRAAPATAARGWSRSTRSRGRTRPATSSARRTCPCRR